MDKKKKIKKSVIIIEFLVWFIIMGFSLVGLIFNFIDGKIFQGVIYSVILLFAIAGLTFNTIYLVKMSKRDLPLPKE